MLIVKLLMPPQASPPPPTEVLALNPTPPAAAHSLLVDVFSDLSAPTAVAEDHLSR